ncbi:MAG: hypothetical protein IJ642_03400 [Oscillospiraceae bacterium]|nr:hypothetical protein [Oscillospiraceae bacterium]
MTITELQEKMKHPVVSDHELIRILIEEMASLPTCCMCKDNLIATKSTKPYREEIQSHISKILQQSFEIDEMQTLAGMLEKIDTFPKEDNPMDYGTLLMNLAAIQTGFTVIQTENERR